MSDQAEKQKTILAMVYMHWVAADAVRVTNRFKVPSIERSRREYGDDVADIGNAASSFYRMLVFYGLVYVVIEAYRTLDNRSDELDSLIDSGPHKKLFQFRNAVFHVQNEPLNDKLWGFLLQPDSQKWIPDVHQGFWTFFKSREPIDEFLTEMKKDFASRVKSRRRVMILRAICLLAGLALLAWAAYLLF